jgi:hypothetical protein
MNEQTRALLPATAQRPPASTADGPVQISVNGRTHFLEQVDISHEQLVLLAYPQIAADRSRSFAVVHRGGSADARHGALAPRQRTRIATGESFDVHVADKS